MPRKVAMIGTTDSSKSAPFDDPSWEIWGVSARNGWVTRADRWFEIHRIDGTFSKAGEADHWREVLKSFVEDVPELWMIYPEPDLVPGKVRAYPLGYMEHRFGTYLMTSTFAWMMALAIAEMCPIDADGTRHFAEKGSKISIWGVDMEYGTEYRQQRQGFRSFIKIAEALGIEVLRITSGGMLYEPVPYPMWQDDPLLCKLEHRNKYTLQLLAERTETLRATREAISSTAGALEEAQKVVPGYNAPERIKELAERHDALMATSSHLSKEIVATEATAQSERWFLDFLMP